MPKLTISMLEEKKYFCICNRQQQYILLRNNYEMFCVCVCACVCSASVCVNVHENV
jgi:hypothetical protein